ncbi:MAG: hypothetical protein Q4B50_03955 [Bacillota bacterium]|nr:hypothetical protein [Bacillota bacterium]
MESLVVIVMIIVAIVNVVSKSKQKAEAAKKAQDQAAVGRSAAPQPQSRSAMVEEQRRRAEAYRRQQPQGQISHNYETPPWKRVPAEPANAAPSPEKRSVPAAATPVPEQRPAFAAAGKPVPLPAEQLVVVVPESPVRTALQVESPSLLEKKHAGRREPPETALPGADFLPKASSEDWRRALVLAEILAPPKSRRGPGSRYF